MKNLLITIKNGMYIPFLHGILYFTTNDFHLSTFISLKLYSTNYFYWFGEHYTYLPKSYNFIKQFVRFTDSGHIVSFIYYVYPNALPLAHNIHFTITGGYWIGKLALNLKDADVLQNEEIIPWFNQYITYCLHGVPYTMMLHDVIICKRQDLFNGTDLFYSYAWLYCWVLFVYIPWCYFTKDRVYSIMENHTSFYEKISGVIMIHALIYIGNQSGIYISKVFILK